jgi:hypothetical protein
MYTTLLIFHGLVGVALLGAITHQAVSLLWAPGSQGKSFVARYTRVNQRSFTTAIVVLYLLGFVLGAVIYPYYRLNVRIPFEQMELGWAVGVFELKEHFAGIGVGLLPLYALAWRSENADRQRGNRIGLTLILGFVVWWDFLIGHVLNNIRGFG